MRNDFVPIFASGLGLLEPVKSNAPHSLILEPQIDSTPPEQSIMDTTVTTTVPPVSFDWNSSGLTNPLDSVPASDKVFDLDFFVTTDEMSNKSKPIVKTSCKLFQCKDNFKKLISISYSFGR